MPTPTLPSSAALDPKQSASGLHFALQDVAQSLSAQVSAAVAARIRRQANADAIGQAIREVLPTILEQAFTQGLLGNQTAARQRRAMLMHLLAATDVQAFVDTPAEDDDDEQLTSETAARLLHVSRTHLNTLVDAGMLGEVGRTAGGHRRISKAAVLAYKAASKARQAQGLSAMAQASKRLGLYGDELAGVPRRTRR